MDVRQNFLAHFFGWNMMKSGDAKGVIKGFFFEFKIHDVVELEFSLRKIFSRQVEQVGIMINSQISHLFGLQKVIESAVSTTKIEHFGVFSDVSQKVFKFWPLMPPGLIELSRKLGVGGFDFVSDALDELLSHNRIIPVYKLILTKVV